MLPSSHESTPQQQTFIAAEVTKGQLGELISEHLLDTAIALLQDSSCTLTFTEEECTSAERLTKTAPFTERTELLYEMRKRKA